MRGLLWAFRILPYVLALTIAAFTGRALLAACDGMWIYSLDDPYIHLALAEQIARGWYGIEPGIASSPSSSILWPFLLAPFSGTAVFAYLPLFINLLVVLLTIDTVGRVVDTVIGIGIGAPRLPEVILRSAAQLMALIGANLIPLSFTGMEHNFHIWLCALLIVSMAQLLLCERLPRWFVPVVILAVLIRYESLAVALPALALAAARRHWKHALAGAAGIGLSMAGFSLFLISQGLEPLPASVLAKARFGVGALDPRASFWFNIEQNLRSPLGVYFLALGFFLFLLAALELLRYLATRKAPSIRLQFAASGAAIAALHMAFGQFGWGGRYEPYALLSILLLLPLALHAPIRRLLRRSVLVPLLMMALILAPPLRHYTAILRATPQAAANIYQQQFQMHRFVVEYLRAPVAVNDLGWVSFQNPYPVLDLWGLGSLEALRHRQAMYHGEIGPEWMDTLARENDIQLAMIYESWLPQPANWQRVARLYLGVPQVSAGDRVVSFYSIDPSDTQRLNDLLQAFQPSLPAGVRLVLD